MGNTCQTENENNVKDPRTSQPEASQPTSSIKNESVSAEKSASPEEDPTAKTTTAAVPEAEAEEAVEKASPSDVELHPTTKEPLTLFTIDEIDGFDTEECCYIIIDRYVYDVTHFLDIHPGGGHYLLDHSGGADATQVFKDSLHSDSAEKMKLDYLVGKLKPGEKTDLQEE